MRAPRPPDPVVDQGGEPGGKRCPRRGFYRPPIKQDFERAVRFPRAKVILGHMGHGNIVYIDGAIAAEHVKAAVVSTGNQSAY